MKRFPLSAILLSLLACAHTAVAQQNETPTPLEPGKAVEQKVTAADEVHTYNFKLAPGSFATVELDQRGTNFLVEVFAGDKPIRSVDMAGTGEMEAISLLGDTAPDYRINVRAAGSSAFLGGSYTLKVSEPHPVTAEDKSRVQAETALEDGMALLVKQGQAERNQALQKFQEAAAFWHAAKDNLGEARSYYFMGYICNVLGQPQKAIDAANQGLPLSKAAGNKSMEAWLLDTIGTAYNDRGQRTEALAMFQQALALRPESDRSGRANTLNNIGIAYAYLSERAKAIENLNQVLPIVRELGDRMKEGTTLGNLCVISKGLGESKKALDYCNQSVAIKREAKDRTGEATSLNNLGSVYSEIGEFQKALDCYLQSLAIHKSLGNLNSQGIALNNIGWIYASLGQEEKAIDYYMQALEPIRKADNRSGVATLLSNIGVSYADLKDFKKALEFHLQSLPLRIASKERDGWAISLNNIAACYSNLGDKPKALEYYNQAIEMHRQDGNPRELAIALRNIGTVYRDIGDLPKALAAFSESLALSRSIDDPTGEAGTLAHVAKLERDRGNLLEARKLIENALAAIESLRVNLKSHQLRASFLASVRKSYDLDVDVLMRLHQQQPTAGYDALAFQVSEKSRARSLLELLREARAEIREGVDPSLIQRERSLRLAIVEKAEAQTRLLSGKHTEEQAAAVAKVLADLTADFDQLQVEIRERSPRYAALTQAAPLSLAEVQAQVAETDTVLLEYSLGEEKSFLWAVTPTSVKSYELAPRTKIEEAARRFYTLLTARSTSVPNETLAQRQQRLDKADAEYLAAASALSELLLGPVAAELKQKRVVVVGDGVLQYIPFAALPEPGATAASPLIVAHEVVNLPSASVLALLRHDLAERKPAHKTVAVLADPVFSATDPRLTAVNNAHSSSTPEVSLVAEVQRSASESGLGDLMRLRFSRQEADDIARLAGSKPNLKAVDFAANRDTALDTQLRDYRIVHFATHGLINNEHPDLSGIVLSLVDRQGRPQNGFLRLYDIYNLKLDADLVVLSACQTALGKQIKGEGLVGLTRGFMYAGAPRVVASYWRIDDRATADMMKRFYQSMLKDGLRPAAALRAAQVSMLQDPRWQAPHYWAAFTLQGEWK